MVRIEFLGAWKDEDVQAVRDVTVTGIEKKLKISVLPAYFEEEYSLIEENCLAFSKNCMKNEKIAPVECDEAEQRMSGVKITISLFPAGNGRMRRQTAQEITKNIALKTGISKDNISVTLDAPPPKNVENFEIRTLGRDDYAQAAEIFAFVHALHQANRPDIYRNTNVPLGEDEFFKMCDDPHEIMLCAVRDGKILGLARTVMRGNAGDAVTLSRVRAVMEELAVLPQAQGMGIGIGTALLYASEAEAKRRGAESLELMVWSFNKSAMRFYESAGMTVRSLVMEKKL